eukprot:TRINITY_DN71123_c0_g1_i1.p1 TRINITY_DN71123_c0_g1~~TRINITY_DN71123_c0_g1_i1.p1  ORF type:complete len:444 (-),score=22.99 TRINITY_DN71123_c0_g1_i1:89-1390(-)
MPPGRSVIVFPGHESVVVDSREEHRLPNTAPDRTSTWQLKKHHAAYHGVDLADHRHVTLHVVRLVHVPYFDRATAADNSYRVVALDRDRELGSTYTSCGARTGPHSQTVNFGFEGTINLYTLEPVIRLRVERPDRQWKGWCVIDRLDPHSSQLHQQMLVDDAGHPVNAWLEVQAVEGNQHTKTMKGLVPWHTEAFKAVEQDLADALHHRHKHGMKLTIHVLRLLDMPRWYCHLFGDPTDFHITVLDDRGDELGRTKNIHGRKYGPDRQSIELDNEIPLKVTTSTPHMQLRVECSDGQLIGCCPLDVNHMNHGHPFVAALTDVIGRPVHCGLELAMTPTLSHHAAQHPAGAHAHTHQAAHRHLHGVAPHPLHNNTGVLGLGPAPHAHRPPSPRGGFQHGAGYPAGSLGHLARRPSPRRSSPGRFPPGSPRGRHL